MYEVRHIHAENDFELERELNDLTGLIVSVASEGYGQWLVIIKTS